jgi:hypothetical protein
MLIPINSVSPLDSLLARIEAHLGTKIRSYVHQAFFMPTRQKGRLAGPGTQGDDHPGCTDDHGNANTAP